MSEDMGCFAADLKPVTKPPTVQKERSEEEEAIVSSLILPLICDTVAFLLVSKKTHCSFFFLGPILTVGIQVGYHRDILSDLYLNESSCCFIALVLGSDRLK